MNRPVLYIGLIFILLIASCDKPTSVKKNSLSSKKSNANYMLSIAKQGTVLAFSPTKSIVTFNAPFTKIINRPVKKDITVADDTGVISYKSSDDTIATVDKNTGLVTPKAAGEVTITATKAATTDKYLQSEATYTLVIRKFKPHNKNALITEIKAATAVRGMNADLNYIDTSLITDMSALFSNANKLSAFEGNISGWDVSNVTTMENMFNGAVKFNDDISNWNVSKVTTMSSMFRGATSFNSDISNWNVLKVTTMSSMFNNAWGFNRNISDWNVSNVTNMSSMFRGTAEFNGDISNWNVSKVTTMSAMFNNAWTFNRNISNWDISKVTDMRHMFEKAIMFNQNLNNWENKLNNAVKANSWEKTRTMFSVSGLEKTLPTWCENVQECKSKQ